MDDIRIKGIGQPCGTLIAFYLSLSISSRFRGSRIYSDRWLLNVGENRRFPEIIVKPANVKSGPGVFLPNFIGCMAFRIFKRNQ